MIASRGTGRIVTGELDSLIIPTDLNLQRPPLVAHHGAGGDGWALLGGDAFPEKIMWDVISRLGLVTTMVSQILMFGNDVCATPVTGRTALAAAYARTKGAHPTKKAIIAGGSMGSFASARAIAKDPDSYQCGVFFLPFMSLQMGLDANPLGVAPSIRTAYGLGPTDPLPAGADLVGSTYLTNLASIPKLFVYSSNDTITFGTGPIPFDFFGFVNTVGGDLINVGAIGHTFDWLTLTDSRLLAVCDWIEEHID